MEEEKYKEEAGGEESLAGSTYSELMDSQDSYTEGYGIDDKFVPTAVFEDGATAEKEKTEEQKETKTIDADNAETSEPVESKPPEVKPEPEPEPEPEPVLEKEPELKEIKLEEEKDEETKTKNVLGGKRRISDHKSSIDYHKASLRTSVQERISGDFTSYDEDAVGDAASSPFIKSFEDDHSYESETEESIEEKEEIPVINREEYYAFYKTTFPEYNLRRIKNNFLHRKMAEYFRKRKMEHVLKETDQQVDSQLRYERKLAKLAELKDFNKREKNSITSELNDMQNQRDEQLTLLNKNFTGMQNREKEIGTGLINTKTGKEIPEKLVERLLKRQKDKWKEVANLRLSYIKIRNKVGEKKTALHALDCIGDNLHLIDYEQLKIENQSHTDKIEERDEELTKLRVKCTSAMQCLAHVREKSAALQIDIQHFTERYQDVQEDCNDSRERLNYFKMECNNCRLETDKVREENGLLAKPKLLCDMEKAMFEVQTTSLQLEELKNENKRLQNFLHAIKKNIYDAELKTTNLRKCPTIRTMDKKRVYKGRPTLVYPELPRSEFSDFDGLL